MGENLGGARREGEVVTTATPYQSYVEARRPAAYDVTKRAVDIIVALVVLVGFLPLWLLIAVAIRLTSPGPALYRAKVAGRGGRPFTYHKFRSMYAGADESVQRDFRRDFILPNEPFRVERTASGEERPVYKVVDDPRGTRGGTIVREA